MRERIILGKWTEDGINTLLEEASAITDTGRRMDFLSEQFLDTPYRKATLTGDANTPEVFVINLEAVDCFTFLDYLEALRLSDSFAEFKDNMKKVRYQSGKITYENRNHFFTDWREFNPDLIEEVTEEISAGKCKRIKKTLNMKDDGTYSLPGVRCREREIVYIPSEAVDDAVIEKLKTGDYAGIYSDKEGLDISHVGIVIKKGETVYLRHASSVKRKVVDEDFREYITGKPGIVVLRPRGNLKNLP
ncbi:MAG: DUF1460 domain-containing protein [Nitrospirae bacterium]|nr:DUF1460 domain-containing protein [Nitrospirota bacterium]